MEKVLYIGCGGFLGAILRYLISIISLRYFGNYMPIGTLIVNVAGGILIGIIMEISINTKVLTPNMIIFLTTGLLGGLTTFSAFSYETINMFYSGRSIMGSLNILLNLSLGLGGVIVGKTIFGIFK